jgi:Spy/CpxP family protein refolding chaperone
MGQGGGWGMGGGMGPGTGQGMGQGMGQDMGRRMGAMAYLMEDPQIRDLMAQIRIVSRVNELGLDRTQVETLLHASQEAQQKVNAQYSGARDEVKNTLRQQLDSVIAGGQFDRDAFQSIREKAQAEGQGDQVREELRQIVDRAMGVLTEEQRQKLQESPRADRWNQRMDGWQNGQGMMGQWMQGLDEDRRQQIQQRLQDRMGQMQDRMGNGKMMMFLMNPQTVIALQKWLDAH